MFPKSEGARGERRRRLRALRRSVPSGGPGPLDHETGEGANENDPSMTKQMRHSLHRVYWNLRGEVPPLMDQDGRPIDGLDS